MMCWLDGRDVGQEGASEPCGLACEWLCPSLLAAPHNPLHCKPRPVRSFPADILCFADALFS